RLGRPGMLGHFLAPAAFPSVAAFARWVHGHIGSELAYGEIIVVRIPYVLQCSVNRTYQGVDLLGSVSKLVYRYLIIYFLVELCATCGHPDEKEDAEDQRKIYIFHHED